MGTQVGALLLNDLKDNPLGHLPGEANLQTPFNATARRPKIYVVNHSAMRARKVIKAAVSWRQGADEALLKSPDLKKAGYTVDTLYNEARRRDMNLYEVKIAPAVFKITWDGEDYFIPPAPHHIEDGKVVVDGEAPVELIPEGAWDFFLGNYEQMHSRDHRERDDAAQRLATYWQKRHNPVFKVVDETGDGIVERQNPYGFLEFRRVIEKEAPHQLDKPFLTALELVEG